MIPRLRFLVGLTGIAAVIGVLTTLMFVMTPASLAAAPGATSGPDGTAWAWGLLAAALSTAASSIGAGFAVARVGTAAVGALAEKPELFGRLLILVGLAEGIAIYGLILSILILNRLV